MFTGIVEETGTVKQIKNGAVSAELKIEGKTIFSDMHLGDSIAVNGVCLTVTSFDKNTFTADVMHETLNRSSLGSLTSGSKVNLERAMSAQGRFGGHIVSGHIDGTGKIESLTKDGIAVWVKISTSKEILRLIVEKCSITIDGISLTVAGLGNDYFQVSVIPHTASNTTLLSKKKGDVVNLENDVVGKYVERLLGFEKQETSKNTSNITMDFLYKNGF